MSKKEECVKAEFSKRLNDAFEKNGYPFRGRASFLSRTFNVSNKAAGKWLNGECIPATSKIPELATLLNVTVEWLLMGIKEENNTSPATSTLKNTSLEKVASLENRLTSLSNSDLTDDHYKIINGMLEGIDSAISAWLKPSELQETL